MYLCRGLASEKPGHSTNAAEWGRGGAWGGGAEGHSFGLRGGGLRGGRSGGGGGSSTFTGLSDTPSSFTADKVLTVNSAGNAVETTFNTSTLSGHQSVEQGYFTGLTLGGTGTGILQNASGTISNLDLADNKFDVSVIEERDYSTGDSHFDSVVLIRRQCKSR